MPDFLHDCTWVDQVNGRADVMRMEELIVGILLVLAIVSYGFVAAITLLT